MSGVEDLVASSGQLAWSLAQQSLKRWYQRGVVVPCRQLMDAWLQVGGCYQAGSPDPSVGQREGWGGVRGIPALFKPRLGPAMALHF
ncbi:unnamed protein product [Arctogadus glacialis]